MIKKFIYNFLERTIVFNRTDSLTILKSWKMILIETIVRDFACYFFIYHA